MRHSVLSSLSASLFIFLCCCQVDHDLLVVCDEHDLRAELARLSSADVEEAHASWEEASESVARACERCSGSRRARCLQTALVLLRMGLEGTASGSRRIQPESPTGGCQEKVQLPEGRGVLKLINLLAPLSRDTGRQSIGSFQQLVEGGCAGAAEDLERLAGIIFMCTRFVVDACNSVLISPEDWDVAKCSSLHKMLPLLESCLPTFDSALVLNGVLRKLQVRFSF